MRMFTKLAVSAVAVVAGVHGAVYSQPPVVNQVEIEPFDAYADIETAIALQTIEHLTGGSKKQRRTAIQTVKESPEIFQPPVFYVLSKVLFESGNKEDGAFYFYAGQLRARFDANRCADLTARQAVAVLNDTYGIAINQYAFQDLSKTEKLVRRVVDWDRTTPHEYDHRWINLHGMGSISASLGTGETIAALSLPENEWPSIAEKTRSDYLNGFLSVAATLKSETENEN